MNFTEEDLQTIHRLCDYLISRRVHFYFHNNIAGSKLCEDDLVTRAEKLNKKVSRMLWPKKSLDEEAPPILCPKQEGSP